MNIEKLKSILDKGKIDHSNEINKLTTLKTACVYCLLNNISSQSFGVLLENYIIAKYSYKRNASTICCGDFKKNDENYELKVSLGGSSFNKFNFVQLRLNHSIEKYLLVAYYLSNDNLNEEGELFIFKLSKQDMIVLIASYGNYAHGTKKNNGEITILGLNDSKNKFEYSVRCKYGDACWKDLLQYRINEDML